MATRDDDLRRIIDEGMRAAVPDAAARGRMLAGLIARLPPRAASAPGELPQALGNGAAVASGGAMKLVVAAVVAVAAIGAVAISGPGAPREPSTRVAADAKATPDPAAAASQPAAIPVPTKIPALDALPPPQPTTSARADATTHVPPPRRPSPVASPVVPSTTPSASGPASDLAAEAGLLAQARAALDAGDPERALSLTARHATEHPAGQLAVERDAVAVIAACMGDEPMAADRACRFLAAHPRQAATASVRSRCADALAAEKSEGE